MSPPAKEEDARLRERLEQLLEHGEWVKKTKAAAKELEGAVESMRKLKAETEKLEEKLEEARPAPTVEQMQEFQTTLSNQVKGLARSVEDLQKGHHERGLGLLVGAAIVPAIFGGALAAAADHYSESLWPLFALCAAAAWPISLLLIWSGAKHLRRSMLWREKGVRAQTIQVMSALASLHAGHTRRDERVLLARASSLLDDIHVPSDSQR